MVARTGGRPTADLRSRAVLWALVLGASLLPASILAADAGVNVANVAPTVSSLTISDATLTPTSGSTTSATVTMAVEDLNGCADIKDVRPDVNVPDNTTVHIDGGSLLQAWDSCSAGLATYTWTFNMQYYHDPATVTGYKVYVVVEDQAGVKSNNLLDLGGLLSFTYAELAALNLNLSSLDFGSNVNPGTSTDVLNLGVQNYGNVQIDTQLSGTDLSHATEAATIAVGNVKYSHANTMTSPGTLTTTSSTNAAFDLAKGASSTRSLYWQMDVPGGSTQWIPSGTYAGTITVSAVKG